MTICSALLKHGYSNFSLTILEYCEPVKCLEREQYYINFLQPEYNILQTAGSSLGFKHTEEARAKIIAARKGKTHSEETLAKLAAARVGKKSPMAGKKHSENTLQKMSVAKQGKNHPMYGKAW
jgi:group I intron endonuclease